LKLFLEEKNIINLISVYCVEEEEEEEEVISLSSFYNK
jgi:hypothetical protein